MIHPDNPGSAVPADPSATTQALDVARRALEDMSRRARLMIDTANDAVVTIDDASCIIDWNRTAERMFGWTREEAIGRVLTDTIVPPQHRASHHAGLAKYLREGTGPILNKRTETTAVDRGGREFDIELSIWPIESGGRHSFSAFIRDISDRKRAEEALRKSEEKYRAVVENANEGIIVSQDGMLKFVNPRGLVLAGRTMEQAMTQPFIEIVHPEDRPRVYSNYVRRMRGEPVENFYNFRVISTSGEVRWLQIAAVAIEWEGRPATLNFLSDVTEQLELQESLRRSLAEREAILETTAVGVMFIQNGRIKWINDALERGMLGWEDGELIGRTGEVAWDDHASWSRFLKVCIPALERDGNYSGDWRVRRKDGTPWWCHASAKALKREDLGAGTIWFFLDITPRLRAEEETRRALLRERELADLKTRFVSLASHEFRTPLATILSSIELVEDFGPELPDGERRELMRIVKAAIARMTTMLDQVLLIGKAEADKLVFQPQPADPVQLASSLAREIEKAQGGKAAIAFHVQGAPGRRLLDANLMSHVLGNLLSNAVKYSPAGSTVEFHMESEPGHLTFRVSDRGIGIPLDDQPRLFESFHRGRNVGSVEGTGLGLTIVRQCVQVLGGSVEFRSEPGQGSTFTVRVPAQAA